LPAFKWLSLTLIFQKFDFSDARSSKKDFCIKYFFGKYM